jgi:Spy/CpxP family protein refolding chaperone
VSAVYAGEHAALQELSTQARERKKAIDAEARTQKQQVDKDFDAKRQELTDANNAKRRAIREKYYGPNYNATEVFADSSGMAENAAQISGIPPEAHVAAASAAPEAVAKDNEL